MAINIEVNTIYTTAEAKLMKAAILADYFENGERDAANGALEAFFVTSLREASKENLGTELESLKADFGDMNAFKRAVERVKAFRSKNKAWETFQVA